MMRFQARAVLIPEAEELSSFSNTSEREDERRHESRSDQLRDSHLRWVTAPVTPVIRSRWTACVPGPVWLS
ncbi:hypothetical protein GLUCOINTEAF2_0202834 [Komagataeibacter intermedius AF2]|uniref:Uncharacterized protein n=1 Tax=Komagataeibacter intermedius AF2 TaxID=1458464 RepID=A0A0N0MEA8_9PROT|nr:hypothetical protein GLUCOINTEAF2_0202834 [Komagataeibacter intermedius AF2]